jgi:2,3-bisphosphoglycerate-dependent phosphoglycerate mutase
VTKRTSQFWDEVIVPQIKAKKRILIVGHENNLRSIIKRLDGIADDDIINVELPRAVPLLYKIDPETLKPVAQSDSADYLTGRYLGDKEQLARIAERDYRQVYDLKITETLETVN